MSTSQPSNPTRRCGSVRDAVTGAVRRYGEAGDALAVFAAVVAEPPAVDLSALVA